MKGLLFFCFASFILLFSIIVINIAPIINGLYKGNINKYDSCQYFSDKYDNDKGQDQNTLNNDKNNLNRCHRVQAMRGLEITSLNVNLVFGFICSLFGFLNYSKLGNVGKFGGLIGIIGGVFGFALTLAYVVESGLVFNDRADFNANNKDFRLDSDGNVLKWDNVKNTYVCIFYEKDNEDSLYNKYSDYGNKYLSYNKEWIFNNDKKYTDCNINPPTHGNYDDLDYEQCKEIDEDEPKSTNLDYILGCDKLNAIYNSNSNEKKIIYDKWLTSIILSCLICLFNIGLSLFGFLLFKESNSSSGAVLIK